MDAERDPALLHVYNSVLHGFSVRLTEVEAAMMIKNGGHSHHLPGSYTPADNCTQRGRRVSWHWHTEFNYRSDEVIGILDSCIWQERRSQRSGHGPSAGCNVASWITTVGPDTLDREFATDVRLGGHPWRVVVQWKEIGRAPSGASCLSWWGRSSGGLDNKSWSSLT